MIIDPETAKRIRVVVSDCDGVLTDGRVTYVPVISRADISWEESCTYSRLDGRGVEKLRAMEIAFEMVTREQANGPHAARAAKLRCTFTPRPQNESRLEAVRAIAAPTRPTGGNGLDHVCYVGDSDTDAEALYAVARAGGWAVTPLHGHLSLRSPIVRANMPGGHGVIEWIADEIAEGRE